MKKELEKLVNSKRNVLVSGCAHSDKTYGVLKPFLKEIIKKNESIVVVDGDYELYNEIYDSLGDYQKIVIDLKNPCRGDQWNPLLLIRDLYNSGKKDYALAYLYEIAIEIMFDRNAVDPFWGESAADLMSAAVLALIVEKRDDELNFNSVAEIINKCATGEGISYLKSINDDTVRRYATGTINAPVETRGGIVSVASQKIRLYASREKLSGLLSKSSFDFDILNKKCAIFIESYKYESYISSLVRLFMSQLFNYIEDNEISNKLNVVVDNFDNISYGTLAYKYLSYNYAKVYLVTRSIDELIKESGHNLKVLANIVNVNDDDIVVTYNDNKDVNCKKIKVDKLTDIKHQYDLKEIEAEDIKVINLNNSFDIDKLIEKIDKKIEELGECD